jgi:hypothetical protein
MVSTEATQLIYNVSRQAVLTTMSSQLMLASTGHGVLIKLAQSSGKPIVFQTPLMSLAWTVQVRTQKDSSTCNLPLSFGTTNSNVMEFKNFLVNLRDKVKSMITANVVDWYGKTLTDVQIDEYLSPLIKEPPADTAYSACFLPKVAHSSTSDGGFNIDVKCFGIDKLKIDAEAGLRQGARVGAIISIPYIHIGKGNKMMSIRADVTQCLVLPVQNDTSFGFDLNLDEDLKAVAQEHEQETKKRKIEDVGGTDAGIPNDQVNAVTSKSDFQELDTSHIEM